MRLIDDNVALMSKPCRNRYVPSDLRAGNCGCPDGRCWYSEQVERRKNGLKAIDPHDWTEDAKKRTEDGDDK